MTTLMTPRWFGGLALALAAMVTCIMLGLWQWHRFEDRSAAVAAVTENYDASPVSIDTVLPSETSALPGARDYTVVEESGEYCTKPECVLYVRNRTLGSSVGFWQLVPFRLDDGGVLLVVRGWVEGASATSAPASEPAVPRGHVTVRARLRATENQLSDRAAVPGQLQSVNAPDVEAQAADLTGIYTGAYGELVTEQGPGTADAPPPRALAKPEKTRGPHLSYAFQWWVFSLLFPIGFVAAARRAIADARWGNDGSHRSDAPAGRVSERKQRMSNEDEEDAYLDERDMQ